MNSDKSKKKIVAIQGIQGSFHEMAAKAYFNGEDIDILMCDTFEKVIESAVNWQSDIAVMAIENSVAGSLLRNYSLLRNSPLVIIGEVYQRITQNLLGIKGSNIENLHEVYSHPVAINQTRTFFYQYPHIKLIESPDTALSAKEASEINDPARGAIASKHSADLYGLDVLAAGIETNKINYTRFLFMTNKDNKHFYSKNVNKSSICFSVPNTAGSLSKVLAILAFYDNNLSKIQSIPIIGREWQYLFYCDVTFNSYERYKQSIEAIKPLTEGFEILGEYEIGIKTFEGINNI